MKRGLIAATAGVVVGLTVSTLVGIPQLSGPAGVGSLLENAFTFWGLFFGTFAGLATFGFVLMLAGRRTLAARVGRGFAIVVLGVLGMLAWWWIAAWRLPLFTLEGMWIYPLAIVPTALAIWLFLAPRRTRKLNASGRVDWTHAP